MRARIAISATFDRQLEQLVDDRNTLAHRIFKSEGVDFTTDDGLKKGIEFLKSLEQQSTAVRNVIQGLMDTINDIPGGDDQKEQYKELAKVIFGEK
jgi:hypothetical protein